MARKFQRTQILLAPEQHRALSQLVQTEGTSLSAVVRELVERQLAQRDQDMERGLSAIERTRRCREEILASRGGKPIEIDVVTLIEQIRDERDGELLEATLGRRRRR